MSIEINSEWQAAIDVIRRGHNTYITGAAGTGKSTLLREVLSRTTKQCAVIAPTGVAALNVGGATIHSLFHFPPRYIDPYTITPDSEVMAVLRRLDLLVIDEASMTRADVMDGMDICLRISRENELPFGGLQIVMFGDLYQLPPVVERDLERHFKDQYGGAYFFNAQVFKRCRFTRITLVKNYRQKDDAFLDLLWKVRTGSAGEEDLRALNKRCMPIAECNEDYVHLTATNWAAKARNKKFLDRIKSPLYKYEANITGKFSRDVLPADLVLELKAGAKVIMLKNDLDGRWVNGTIGQVAALDTDCVSVSLDGQIHQVPREEWEQIQYVCRGGRVITEVVGVFQQYPVRLAWAMTIHKSQGHTLNKICVDLGRGAFAHGQTYVALSRCTSLEGIVLRQRLSERDIIVDPVIVEYESAQVQHRVRENTIVTTELQETCVPKGGAEK